MVVATLIISTYLIALAALVGAALLTSWMTRMPRRWRRVGRHDHPASSISVGLDDAILIIDGHARLIQGANVVFDTRRYTIADEDAASPWAQEESVHDDAEG